MGTDGGYRLWGAGAVGNRTRRRNLPAATSNKQLAGGFAFEIWKRANRFSGARRRRLSREKPGVPSESAHCDLHAAGSGDPPTPPFPAGSGICGHGEASRCSRTRTRTAPERRVTLPLRDAGA